MNGALPHAQIREEAQEEADFLKAAEAANNNCSGKIRSNFLYLLETTVEFRVTSDTNHILTAKLISVRRYFKLHRSFISLPFLEVESRAKTYHGGNHNLTFRHGERRSPKLVREKRC